MKKNIKEIKKKILNELKGKQEIIINKCFGGFGISVEAILLLIKRKAKCIEKIKIDDYYGGSKKYIGKPCYAKDWKDKFDKDFKEAKDLGDGFFVYGFAGIITDKEFIYSADKSDKKIRTDEDLIKVVKELGVRANGGYAELKIVEIPPNIKWEISDYDGMESIHKKHQVWS